MWPLVSYLVLIAYESLFRQVFDLVTCTLGHMPQASLLSLWAKSFSVTIQIKATDQYLHVALFTLCTRWF